MHDRVLFVDQRGWVIGQSIKDAAAKKPTYLIELNEPSLTADGEIHNRIWAAARIVNLVTSASTSSRRLPPRATVHADTEGQHRVDLAELFKVGHR